jgi:hypothetical protein
MVVKMLMLVFWVVTPCGLVGRYQCSLKYWYLPRSSQSITTQKTNADYLNLRWSLVCYCVRMESVDNIQYILKKISAGILWTQVVLVPFV